jgi:hypothetical protein
MRWDVDAARNCEIYEREREREREREKKREKERGRGRVCCRGVR